MHRHTPPPAEPAARRTTYNWGRFGRHRLRAPDGAVVDLPVPTTGVRSVWVATLWHDPEADDGWSYDLWPVHDRTGRGWRLPTQLAAGVVHVIFAVPAIAKSGDRQVIRPGVPATFTLTYSANGSGSIPAMVDGYTIVDTLPVGMTYVTGSASREPMVTTNASGQQVLTWNLDDVPTNTQNTSTYQATADASVTPGQTLTNTATSSLAGETSRPATAQVTVSTRGYTLIGKTADQVYIPNPTADGVGTGSWTVTLRSFDPLPQDFTDTIDILPYNGDGRGTSFNGTYALDEVTVPAGATVYYTTVAPGDLSDDPADPSNGAANAPSAIWTTTRPATGITAIRVLGPELPPGGTFQFQVSITTDGAMGGDVYVNRAQARAEHTQLVMRTSDPTTMATFYSAQLKKYVQDRDGVWRDANDVTDYPTYEVGEEVPYRIVITNTGRGTLRNFTITDDKFTGGSFTIVELAPQQSHTHEFKVTLTEAHLGTVVNTACATVDIPSDAVPPPEINCDPAGIEVARTIFVKTLLGTAEPNGDGTYTVTYGIKVTREGMPGIYRLTDTLRYGAGTTIRSTTVANIDPGTVETNTAWNGTTDTEVAAGVAIEVGDTHEFRATVVTAVDPQIATGDSSDCNLAGGESGTGFLNQARLEIDDKEFDDEECPTFPVIRHTKELAGDPVRNRDGTYTISYEIVVTSIGAAVGTYDLEDKLVYGSGITIRSASVANTAPGGLSTSATWNGTTGLLVVSDQSLDPGASHTYTVTVRATVPGGLSSTIRDCELMAGETGSGFRNESTLTTNGTQQHDDACAPPSDPGGRLARTGTSTSWQVGAGLLLMAVGSVLVAEGQRRRRHDAMGIAA